MNKVSLAKENKIVRALSSPQLKYKYMGHETEHSLIIQFYFGSDDITFIRNLNPSNVLTMDQMTVCNL